MTKEEVTESPGRGDYGNGELPVGFLSSATIQAQVMRTARLLVITHATAEALPGLGGSVPLHYIQQHNYSLYHTSCGDE